MLDKYLTHTLARYKLGTYTNAGLLSNFFTLISCQIHSQPQVFKSDGEGGNGYYRVNQQYCPDENCLETPGGSPDILAKTMENPDKIFKKNFFLIFFFENFVWICQGFSQKIRRGGLRTISAGTTLMIHTVHTA